jgi:protein-L-isoaspartate O-methyltransferase
VLEIGTGSGYQAAILVAMLLDVYTIEIVPDLKVFNLHVGQRLLLIRVLLLHM